MWLAVMRMILEMGDILGEKADMDKYRAILDKGKKSYQTKLWNGKGIVIQYYSLIVTFIMKFSFPNQNEA